MKKLSLLLVLGILTACASQKKLTSENNINKTVPYKDTVILLGKANKQGFLQPPFSSWFTENYNLYHADNNTLNELKTALKDVTIKVFMGTWCKDSKREVPFFYKILETASFNSENLTLYAVSRDKTTPEQHEKNLNIERVPTFIFYKDGKELGRIVEYPIETLEKDMLTIVTNQPYKHAYEE